VEEVGEPSESQRTLLPLSYYSEFPLPLLTKKVDSHLTPHSVDEKFCQTGLRIDSIRSTPAGFNPSGYG